MNHTSNFHCLYISHSIVARKQPSVTIVFIFRCFFLSFFLSFFFGHIMNHDRLSISMDGKETTIQGILEDRVDMYEMTHPCLSDGSNVRFELLSLQVNKDLH